MPPQRRKFFRIGRPALSQLAVGIACVAGGVLVLSAPASAAAVSTWSIVQSPNTSSTQDNALSTVSCSGPAFCMAVGTYQGPTTQLTLSERWNGSSWSIVPSPNGSTTHFNSLGGISCTSSTWCVATGSYSDGSVTHTLAESWDGHSWTIMQTVDPSTASGFRSQFLGGVVCFSASDCTAVGDYTVGVNTDQTLVEQWNGAAWSVVPSPSTAAGNNYLSGLSCPVPSSCMAVGAGDGLPLFESWNGSTWSIVANPNPSPTLGVELNDVTCTNPSFCVAVGDNHFAAMSYPTLVEMWNGATWSIVPSPSMPSSDENILNSVACTDPANCVATGHWSDVNDTTDQTLIERWNGTSWSIVPSPNTSSTLQNDLNGVTCSATTQCFTVGGASTAGPEQTLIEAAPVAGIRLLRSSFGRRLLRLRRTLLRVYGGQAPQQADRGHGRRPSHRRLLGGGLRRRHLRLQRARSTGPWAASPQQADRRHGLRPGDRRLLGGGLRRRHLRLQRCRSSGSMGGQP